MRYLVSMGCAGNAPERFESIELLDAQLASMTRQEAGARLRLGQVLEVMQRKACCCELGFSSLSAYALERAERSARWVEVACCLARRLEGLPSLRGALATGRLSWSKAELLARLAQPENEAHWLELAERQTLRELRREVSKVRDIAAAEDADEALMDEREATGVLTCTLDREDAWLLEATRELLDQFGTRGAEAQVEALLAEGQGALLAALPGGALDREGLDPMAEAQQRWREQLGRWRTEAETRCEPRIRAAVLERAESSNAVALQAAQGLSSLEGWKSQALDHEVRRLSAALAEHELKLSRLLCRFHRAVAGAGSATRRRRNTPASGSACRARRCWRGARSPCGSRRCRSSPRRSAARRSEWRLRCSSCASQHRRRSSRGSSALGSAL